MFNVSYDINDLEEFGFDAKIQAYSKKYNREIPGILVPEALRSKVIKDLSIQVPESP
jgi:hypothetical protein